MDIFLILFVIFWMFKVISPFVKKEEKRTDVTVAVELTIGILFPLLILARVYIWNSWGHNWISFPEIHDIKSLMILFLFF